MDGKKRWFILWCRWDWLVYLGASELAPCVRACHLSSASWMPPGFVIVVVFGLIRCGSPLSWCVGCIWEYTLSTSQSSSLRNWRALEYWEQTGNRLGQCSSLLPSLWASQGQTGQCPLSAQLIDTENGPLVGLFCDHVRAVPLTERLSGILVPTLQVKGEVGARIFTAQSAD